MARYTSYLDFPMPSQHTAVVIGKFDGFHVGHRTLLRVLVGLAATRDLLPLAFTFFPHPQLSNIPGTLISLEGKYAALDKAGMRDVIDQEFHPAFLRLSPEEFIEDVLVRRLRCKHVVVGDDFRFGKGQRGDVETLKAARDNGFFDLTVADKVLDEGGRVSSSRIRSALLAGDLNQANRLLERPYEVRGRVVFGAQRGRTMGFPTLNLACGFDLLPAKGIYAAWAFIDGISYPAAVYIGPNPTFGGVETRLEVHLINVSGYNGYGKNVRVQFIEYLRTDQAFASARDLAAQIHKDVAAAREILGAASRG